MSKESEFLRLSILERVSNKYSTRIRCIDQEEYCRDIFATDLIDAIINGLEIKHGSMTGHFRTVKKGGSGKKGLKYVPQ